MTNSIINQLFKDLPDTALFYTSFHRFYAVLNFSKTRPGSCFLGAQQTQSDLFIERLRGNICNP